MALSTSARSRHTDLLHGEVDPFLDSNVSGSAPSSPRKGKWKMTMSKRKLTAILAAFGILLFLWHDAVLEKEEAALLKKVNSYFVNDPNVMCGCMTISIISQSSRKTWEQVAFPVMNPNCPRESFAKSKPPPVSSGSDNDSRPLTILLVYYNDIRRLLKQFESWESFTTIDWSKIELVIVDDGSAQENSVQRVLQANKQGIQERFPALNIHAYAIEQDIIWNVGGVRNLGIYMSPTEWVLTYDVDNTLDEEMLKSVYDYVTKHEERKRRDLIRNSLPFIRLADNKTLPHPAHMLTTRSAYWLAGGSDEDFSGNYGLDDIHFFRRIDMEKKVELKNGLGNSPFNGTFAQIEDSGCPSWADCLGFTKPTFRAARNANFNRELMKLKENGTVAWSNDYLRYSWVDLEDWK